MISCRARLVVAALVVGACVAGWRLHLRSNPWRARVQVRRRGPSQLALYCTLARARRRSEVGRGGGKEKDGQACPFAAIPSTRSIRRIYLHLPQLYERDMERVKGMEERWWWMMDQCITRSESESSEHASFCAAHA